MLYSLKYEEQENEIPESVISIYHKFLLHHDEDIREAFIALYK